MFGEKASDPEAPVNKIGGAEREWERKGRFGRL
jgi:hypothetical protein